MKLALIALSRLSFAADQPFTYAVPDALAQTVQAGGRVIVPFGQGNRATEAFVLRRYEGEAPQNIKLKYISAVLDEQPVLDAHGIRLLLWLRERYFSTVYQTLSTMLPTGLTYTIRDCYDLAETCTQEDMLKAGRHSPATKRLLSFLQAEGKTELSRVVEILDLKNPNPRLRQLVEDGILTVQTEAERKAKDKMEWVVSLADAQNDLLPQLEKTRKTSPGRYAVVALLATLGRATVKELQYFTGASRAVIKRMEQAGFLSLEEREVLRRVPQDFPPTPPPEIVLNDAQTQACRGIWHLCQQNKADVALLYGVTGSGKTQVYLSLIHQTLAQGKTALLLVPEIALTAKLLELFLLHFREKVAILHSALPMHERYEAWKRCRAGEATVVLGTRSAVFAPLQQLGLLILDEEQEESYQSEHLLRYHAREVAKFRCVQENALLLLGSATPAIETMQAAKEGRYHLFSLQERYNAQALPQVSMVDMKPELRRGNDTGLSRVLLHELEENFKRGEQSILFLNRRGSHQRVACGSCDESPMCPHCSVYLHYHRANGRLMCHLCGYSTSLPETCPSCGEQLYFIGHGTQGIESALKKHYPNIEVLRMDADTINAETSHDVLLDRFVQNNIPILLGTQMVAKGLDFENVTLVGVIDADLSLYQSHFRARERTFSLITQVVGRAGRGERQGRAILQTYSPNSDILTLAAAQNYDDFFVQESLLRRLQALPPFGDFFRLEVRGEEEAEVVHLAEQLRLTLDAFCTEQQDETPPPQVLGPAPAPILKVAGRYRYQLTLQAPNHKENRLMLANLLRMVQNDPKNRNLSLIVDVNAMD